MANKVQFGLSNVHYATVTESGGSITYGSPVAWPGAVSISLDAEGGSEDFFADNTKYFTTFANNGYKGDFASAKVPESFRTDIMGETLDSTTKMYKENASVQPNAFALLFEFEGDESKTKYVFYNCKMSRPAVDSKTSEDSTEVGTVTGEITANPRADGIVKATCSDSTSSAYTAWYTAVQE